MCMVKTPKIKKSDAAAKEPDPAIIRNPYLDNSREFQETRLGRSQLRIDPGTPRGVRPNAPRPVQSPPPPTSATSTSRNPALSAHLNPNSFVGALLGIGLNSQG